VECFRVTGDFLYLSVRVVPGASKSGIVEVKNDKLKIRIAAVPEDGKANKELCLFLSNTLELPKKDIVIASGEKSRIKVLRLPLAAEEKLDRICKIL